MWAYLQGAQLIAKHDSGEVQRQLVAQRFVVQPFFAQQQYVALQLCCLEIADLETNVLREQRGVPCASVPPMTTKGKDPL